MKLCYIIADTLMGGGRHRRIRTNKSIGGGWWRDGEIPGFNKWLTFQRINQVNRFSSKLTKNWQLAYHAFP